MILGYFNMSFYKQLRRPALQLRVNKAIKPTVVGGVGAVLAQVEVLWWGRGFGQWKTSDHQLDCTKVAPNISRCLYLNLNRVFHNRVTCTALLLASISDFKNYITTYRIHHDQFECPHCPSLCFPKYTFPSPE